MDRTWLIWSDIGGDHIYLATQTKGKALEHLREQIGEFVSQKIGESSYTILNGMYFIDQLKNVLPRHKEMVAEWIMADSIHDEWLSRA